MSFFANILLPDVSKRQRHCEHAAAPISAVFPADGGGFSGGRRCFFRQTEGPACSAVVFFIKKIKKTKIMLDNKKNIRYKLFRTTNARVAQLVEQRTENPRVGGSIPSPSTIQKPWKFSEAFCLLNFEIDDVMQKKRHLNRCLFFANWRREWDSNPRWTYAHDGFQDRCIKPLCHLSNNLYIRFPSYRNSVSTTVCGSTASLYK